MERSESSRGKLVTRRRALGWIGSATLALAAGACTPVRIVLKMYPEEFETDPDLVDGVLRAFVTAVVPGMPGDHPNLTRAFYDDYYRLSKYRNFLAADLCERSRSMYGRTEFAELSLEQRTRVIEDGLDRGGVTKRLYVGAVFLAQIATYAGIYDAEEGCPLIGFQGRYDLSELAHVSHPHPERFLPPSRTTDGNPV
ncbi:MAG: hypothetical protein V3T74_06880 [Gemmatimonadales bacterium]